MNISEDLKEIKETMKGFNELNVSMTKLSSDFVPVQKIADGIMTVIGLAFLGAMIALVLR